MEGRTRKATRPRKSVFFTVVPPEGGTGEGSGQPPAAGTGAEGSAEKQLPQSKVNEIVAAESRKAAEKAATDLAGQLGVSVDEAKTIIADHKKRVDGEKSEAQLAREAADREKAEAEKAKAEAVAEVFATRADRALVGAGADATNDSALARLRGLLTVKPGASADEIKADVKAVAETFPALFGSATGGGTPPAPGSDPKARVKPRGTGDDPMKRGAERAAARYARADRPKPPGVA